MSNVEGTPTDDENSGASSRVHSAHGLESVAGERDRELYYMTNRREALKKRRLMPMMAGEDCLSELQEKEN